MEKKIKTTGIIGVISAYMGIIRYIFGLYREKGKENGNYHDGFRVYCMWADSNP